jgi:hypothetical protein
VVTRGGAKRRPEDLVIVSRFLHQIRRGEPRPDDEKNEP